MNDKPIGILDSGIGGMTVAKEVITLLPNESLIYIGDSRNTPYGALSAEVIHTYARKMVMSLLQKDVKLIVIACNTITVHCIDDLRREFPQVPIIGTVPVVKSAAERSKSKRIGILSTSQTARSAYQKDLIDTYADGCTVFTHGTDDLVPLIENMVLDGEEMEKVLTHVLEKFKKERVDTLALGCTHFPLVRSSMQRILGKDILLLDSGEAIARHVKRILSKNNNLSTTNKGTYTFYTTGIVQTMQFIGESLELQIASNMIHSTTI
jgi:glutamate racemase